MALPRILLTLLVLLSAGCTTGGDFPSLAPRAVEQLSFEEPVKVDPPVAADPALSARANALLAEARQGDRAFDAAYIQALPRVRAGGAAGSDSWVQAQEAISRVEAARNATSTALADLDRFVTDQSDDPVNDAVWGEVLSAREAAQALVNEQERRLAELRNSLRAP
jgi:hypothetical protein